ncbi:MAG TPA: DUF4337 family protein [Acetobacteraceae bacterium]|nr:DUF4337 family protein [Acetobacteraceae bacterium]
MSENVELANQGFEHAHHEVEHAAPQHEGRARRIAVLIAALAAALAISEMGEKSAQNEYLTRHIALSDDYNFYQAKHTRAVMIGATADVLASLPPSAETARRIAALRAAASHDESDPKAGNGAKQLLEKAKQQTEARDHAFHRYHQFEWVVGALQIAIVLASVAVVTRVAALAVGGVVLGGLGVVFGLLVAFGAM